jgi:hypothetical protein
MTHDLESMPSGLRRCQTCGALFWGHDEVAKIEATPCKPPPQVLFDVDPIDLLSLGIERDIHTPPPVLYTLSPLSPRRRVDQMGDDLIDAWLKEWRGGA